MTSNPKQRYRFSEAPIWKSSENIMKRRERRPGIMTKFPNIYRVIPWSLLHMQKWSLGFFKIEWISIALSHWTRRGISADEPLIRVSQSLKSQQKVALLTRKSVNRVTFFSLL